MRKYIRRHHMIIEAVSYVMGIASLVLAIVGMFIVKGDIPIHYNLAGDPDGWGSAGGLVVFPIIMLFTNVIISIMMRVTNEYHVNLPYSIAEDKMPQAMNLTIWMLEACIFDFSLMSLIMIIMSILQKSAGGVVTLITFILLIQITVIIIIMGKTCKKR